MRLVADESCDFSVIVGVRGAGHDVIAIAELMSGIDDEKVIELAASQQRLLLTEDKDFGQLVFAAAKQNSGVILTRYPTSARSTLTEAVVKLLHSRLRHPEQPSQGYYINLNPVGSAMKPAVTAAPLPPTESVRNTLEPRRRQLVIFTCSTSRVEPLGQTLALTGYARISGSPSASVVANKAQSRQSCRQ